MMIRPVLSGQWLSRDLLIGRDFVHSTGKIISYVNGNGIFGNQRSSYLFLSYFWVSSAYTDAYNFSTYKKCIMYILNASTRFFRLISTNLSGGFARVYTCVAIGPTSLFFETTYLVVVNFV